MKTLLTGNEALARGAWEAGVRVVSSYPGTPSTEITENAANYEEMYCEWAPNEKVALETAIGASLAGGRALACMKHVGVNVAMDPLLAVTYTGIQGGLVLISADDPGMHSSQNEQDNRLLGAFAKMPVLEPSDSAEAKDFIKAAYVISETFDTPVMVRMTTRVAHSQSLVELEERAEPSLPDYQKNAQKYVMIPANARPRHTAAEEQLLKLKEWVETTGLNRQELNGRRLGVITAGVVYQYVKEALPEASILKLGVTNPLPAALIKDFAAGVDTLYVIEELEDVIEGFCRQMGLAVHGKDTFSWEGEIFPETIRECILGQSTDVAYPYPGVIPPRPPVLCAGCPHRATFHALKRLKLNVIGDIGCYTLGCAAPLSSLDTTLCMGASIGMAHGMEKVRGRQFARETVAIIGDSTFMHSGITPLIDVVYNRGATTTLILDNSITAMTGHQDNPLTGRTVSGKPTKTIDLTALVRGIGVERVVTADPFDAKAFRQIIKGELSADEPSVIIVRRPCELLLKEKRPPYAINATDCRQCGTCESIGCPAIENRDGAPLIRTDNCVGCGFCATICPHHAINEEGV